MYFRRSKTRELNVSGVFILRGDCVLLEQFDAMTFAERSFTQKGKWTVFPFKVWEHGGPADQIIYVPENQLTQFKEALWRFPIYPEASLNRGSLHYMHCRKGLRGRLVYFHDCKCNANTEKEWNPFYKMVGRENAQQKLSARLKWGTYWFDENEVQEV